MNINLSKAILIILAILFFAWIATSLFKSENTNLEEPQPEKRVWQIKSIDTMKYSRDVAGEKIKDFSFDTVISKQVKSIKEANATHVAIGTPYDKEFTPFLKRWVKEARNNNLNVWFRGNFSGWQGWFGYPRDLTREEHIKLTREFILSNPDLFQNGDIFTPCPECENGGPGDPRSNGDVKGHREFLIAERNAAIEEFNAIGKNVTVIDSMNYDVAQLIMDKETTQAMGGVVVIDHYVKNPQRLADDISKIAQKTNAKVVLGEFGAPIPDIHGKLSEEEQAAWVEEALNLIKDKEELLGLNYWTSYGGSTEIFNDDYTPKKAAEILKNYFSLTSLD